MYHRASEGLPYFDRLVYRFIGEPGDSSLVALQNGECDVVDVNDQFQPMFPGLLDRESNGSLITYTGQGPEWEHLDFGIRPAAYDDGYDPAGGDRPDLFGDARTRQAVAYCLDRQGIVNELLYQRSIVPQTYLPAGHPLAAVDLPNYPFDPAAGMRLLDEVGWKDSDGDANTPRVASGVPGVPDGTPLTAVYRTSQAALRRQVTERAAQSLVACGIGITSEFLSPGDLFGPGPEGLVFGRKFDLVQFSWEASSRPNCLLYTSQQIPSEANRWVGANVSGYDSAAFDAACTAAYHARSNDPAFAALNHQVQQQFATDLPVIPLYGHLKIAISRPDFCGLELDVTARSIFWNLEGFNLGSECAQ
jgi:peptide/nickel transport system substrate-binding protein